MLLSFLLIVPRVPRQASHRSPLTVTPQLQRYSINQHLIVMRKSDYARIHFLLMRTPTTPPELCFISNFSPPLAQLYCCLPSATAMVDRILTKFKSHLFPHLRLHHPTGRCLTILLGVPNEANHRRCTSATHCVLQFFFVILKFQKSSLPLVCFPCRFV